MAVQREKDTICAVSTPHGVGGISVIRVSGSQALIIGKKAANFLPAVPESHRIYFGTLKDRNSSALDEVLISYFAEGRSFTGEETIEISCHGSPQICDAILSELIFFGARAADRGEFTFRSFMNGKLDLVQAEAVLSMIESQSKNSAKLALRQLKGELSLKFNQIIDHLTWSLAHIEAGIDFSTEGLDVIDHEALTSKLSSIGGLIQPLVTNFEQGRFLKDGVRVVLLGRPNVGKSSLLNQLLGFDRAIVSDIAGTTRDVVEGSVLHRGVKFTFVDTAGLRESSDQIEKLGIKRSLEQQREADVILFVIDGAAGLSGEDLKFLDFNSDSKFFFVINKSDLIANKDESYKKIKNIIAAKYPALYSLETSALSAKEPINRVGSALGGFMVSALHNEDRNKLLDGVFAALGIMNFENDVLISQARQYENLLLVDKNVSQALDQLKAGIGSEFVALELKEALMRLQEIVGVRFDDQIMDRVFKEFCIGK